MIINRVFIQLTLFSTEMASGRRTIYRPVRYRESLLVHLPHICQGMWALIAIDNWEPSVWIGREKETQGNRTKSHCPRWDSDEPRQGNWKKTAKRALVRRLKAKKNVTMTQNSQSLGVLGGDKAL